MFERTPARVLQYLQLRLDADARRAVRALSRSFASFLMVSPVSCAGISRRMEHAVGMEKWQHVAAGTD